MFAMGEFAGLLEESVKQTANVNVATKSVSTTVVKRIYVGATTNAQVIKNVKVVNALKIA
jgi:hypothetical protein